MSRIASLSFHLASKTLTFSFSDNATYDLAMMQKNELIGLLKFRLLKCLDFSMSWYSNFNPSFSLSLCLSIMSLSKETQHCQLHAVNINLNSY
jgi:hypothetical protein